MRRWTFALIVAAVVGTGLVAGAGPAVAAPDAVISREIFLANYGPTHGGYATLRTYDREIVLAAGDYRWAHGWLEQTPNTVTENSRDIRLDAGTYYWNCSVLPYQDIYYETRCYLRLAGHANAYTEFVYLNPSGADYHAGWSGSWYYWTSTLTRL